MEKEEPMELSVLLITGYWVSIQKKLSILKKHLKIAMETGDRAGDGGACETLGNAY